MLEIFGFIAALFIGLLLGLMGGGGSIVTVPVLVYLMHYSPVVATGYSLFVVGSTSVVGASMYWKRGLIDFKTALSFGIPASIAVYLTRQFIIPAIPDKMFEIGSFHVTKSIFLMLLFAVILIMASMSMVKGRQRVEKAPGEQNIIQRSVLLQGVGIGFLTGMVGVGGGFMIVPALVILSGLSMKRAVGTSLLIIAANSLIGFLGDIFRSDIDWRFLLVFTVISIIGIFIGNFLSKKIPGEKLKKSFGWFVLIMGLYILLKEIWF
ncbi:sulfite exporter TauE/SafE family protein [Cryomorpha ignava]|uniref:Probable membrane transporter protein n=1 Tax=Cryomorpha ignava TaxID=101383 RepID=A0A7K3WUU9_9FLAO|nr:sulfite exporter TauE/SafE family protein [Cryomorpha ignava]NEN25284.1 sulfite exporter TauE/SafE family protein [Cryomorpha ignava]